MPEYTESKWSALDSLCFADGEVWNELFAALRERLDCLMGCDYEHGIPGDTVTGGTLKPPDRVASLIAPTALAAAADGWYALTNGYLGQNDAGGASYATYSYVSPGTIVYRVDTGTYLQQTTTATNTITVGAPGTAYDGTYTYLSNAATVYVLDPVVSRTRSTLGRYIQISSTLWVKVSTANTVNTISYDGTYWWLKEGTTALYRGIGDTLLGVTWTGLGTFRRAPSIVISALPTYPIWQHASGWLLIPRFNAADVYASSVIITAAGAYCTYVSTMKPILTRSWVEVADKSLIPNTGWDIGGLFTPVGASPLYALLETIKQLMGITTGSPFLWSDYSEMLFDYTARDYWESYCQQSTAMPILHTNHTTWSADIMYPMPAMGSTSNGQPVYSYGTAIRIAYDGSQWVLYWSNNIVGTCATLTGTYTLNANGLLWLGTAAVNYSFSLLEWIESVEAQNMTMLLSSWEAVLACRVILNLMCNYGVAVGTEYPLYGGWYTYTYNMYTGGELTINSKDNGKIRKYKVKLTDNWTHVVTYLESDWTTEAVYVFSDLPEDTSLQPMIEYDFDYV